MTHKICHTIRNGNMEERAWNFVLEWEKHIIMQLRISQSCIDKHCGYGIDIFKTKKQIENGNVNVILSP